MKLNLAGIALKRFQNANRNKRNTQKSRSKSFLLNFVSIFRTAIYDDYIPYKPMNLRCYTMSYYKINRSHGVWRTCSNCSENGLNLTVRFKAVLLGVN